MMISKKGHGFGTIWTGTLVGLTVSVAFTAYLVWRLSSPWPVGLMAVSVVGVAVFLWYALRAMDRRHRATLEALERQSQPRQSQAPETETSSDERIVTTEEELEGFRIVKAIVCGVVEPERIASRDTKSYFGVLLDDNNRKPICRLRFNRSQLYVGLFDAEKNETRHPIDNVDGIYAFADQLRDTVRGYLEASSAANPKPE